jgi:hypothetical protein
MKKWSLPASVGVGKSCRARLPDQIALKRRERWLNPKTAAALQELIILSSAVVCIAIL